MSGEAEWRWADPTGKQRIVRMDELRAALASGVVAPNTPVWRTGWTEWRPAQEVPELMTSALSAANGVVPNIPPPPLFVVAAQTEFENRSQPHARVEKEPPVPPRYVPSAPRIQAVPPSSSGPQTKPAGSAPRGSRTMMGVAPPRLAAPESAPVLPPPRRPLVSEPDPNLDSGWGVEEGSVILSDRPPSGSSDPSPPAPETQKTPAGPPPRFASPPAPLVHPVAPLIPPKSKDARATLILYGSPSEKTPPNPPSESGPPIVVPSPGAQMPNAVTRPPPWGEGAVEIGPHIPRDAPRKRADSVEELTDSAFRMDPSTENLQGNTADLPGPSRAPAATTAAVSHDVAVPSPTNGDHVSSLLPGARAFELSRWRVLAGIAVGVILLATIGIIFANWRSSSDPGATAAKLPPSSAPIASSTPPIESASPQLSPPLEPGPCSVSGEPRVLAARALVPSGLELMPTANALFLGYATAPREGALTQVDLATFTAARTIKIRAGDSIRHVTPLPNAKALAVAMDLDRKGDKAQGRRTVATDPLFEVAVIDSNLVLLHGADKPIKLWSLSGDTAMEAPHAILLAKEGDKAFALAFRRGSSIWLGLIAAEKGFAPKGELFKVSGLGSQIGAPALAVSGGTVLVAWADRASSSELWGLRWLRWTPGSAPEKPQSFALPTGGLGGQAMSPTVEGLDASRFLLVWTEGPVSNHQVRAQVVDAGGKVIGTPLTISREGVNAGQADVALSGDGRGGVAYLASHGRNFEVVLTPLACKGAGM